MQPSDTDPKLQHLRKLAQTMLDAEVSAAMGDEPSPAFAQASIESALLLRPDERKMLEEIKAQEEAALLTKLDTMLQQVRDHAEKIKKA